MSDDIRDRIKRVLAGAKERELDATEVRVLRDADAEIVRLRFEWRCALLGVECLRETLLDIATQAGRAREKVQCKGKPSRGPAKPA